MGPTETAQAVALVYQPYKEDTIALARAVREMLVQRGVGTRLLSAFNLLEHDARGLRLAMTFGGDGTVLRAARWLAATRVPIVPIRMGMLSFLGELAPESLPSGLDPYLRGEFRLDERTMLHAEGPGCTAVALNDVVIGRGAASRAVKLDVWVDDAFLSRYVADGLVVASATGSTGYALAAGGPVLAPDLDCMVLQPVAPHLASLRSLVLSGASRVRVRMHTTQPGVLTIDGQVDYPFEDGQEVIIAVAAERTLFARRGQKTEFFQDLAARLVR